MTNIFGKLPKFVQNGPRTENMTRVLFIVVCPSYIKKKITLPSSLIVSCSVRQFEPSTSLAEDFYCCIHRLGYCLDMMTRKEEAIYFSKNVRYDKRLSQFTW